MSGKRLEEETWAKIQVCYEDTAEPVTQMAYRFGVSVSLIYRYATSKGWKKQPPRFPALKPPRPLPAPRPAAASEAGAGEDGVLPGSAPETAGAEGLSSKPARPLGPPQSTEARLRRLLAVIDRQLENLEHHMTSPDEKTPQEEERLVRAVGSTIANLERVTEMNTEREKNAAGKRGKRKADAGDMRRQIAERLERLNAQWQAHGKPR